MLDNFYGFECAETNHGVQNLSLDEVSYLVFKSIICTSSIIQLKPKLNGANALSPLLYTIDLTQQNSYYKKHKGLIRNSMYNCVL